MSRAQKIAVLGGVGIVAALAGALLARWVVMASRPPVLESGTVVEPARAVAPFKLIDADGAPFTPERLRGRWSFMFFGFTHCGDVCPTTLALLAAMNKTLSDLPAPQRPQVVFVSVDARRDTPEVIRTYLKNFDANFVGITGAQPELDAFAASLGVPAGIRQLENGGYAVDHSAAILAFNPSGNFRALFSPPHGIDALARDYRALVRE